jgi:hypothetical protein
VCVWLRFFYRGGLARPHTPALLVLWLSVWVWFGGVSREPIGPDLRADGSRLLGCAVGSNGGPLVGVFATHAGVRTLRPPTSDLAVSTHTCLRIVVASKAPAVRRTHSSSPDFF